MANDIPQLVLWDIDHTLVTIQGVSHDIYARAFEQVVGRRMEYLADMTGRTEQAIITDTLVLNGVDPSTSFDLFYTALGEAARSLEPKMRQHGAALPGAARAIASLAGDGTVQTVVTGNIKSIAITKLEAFGLNELIDFEVGGYGDDGSDRAELVRLAVERAEAKYNVGFTAEHAVVIGDTPHDVRGARDNGALAVGVATGSSTTDELIEAGADGALSNLVELERLRELLGRPRS